MTKPVTATEFRSDLARRAARGGGGDLTAMYERTDPARRKSRGQFFTPPHIAEFMVGYGAGARTVLDPACGLGVFLKKAADAGARAVYGIDVDENMIDACRIDLGARRRARLRRADYILDGAPGVPKVDFLVCNPPYLGFHGFDRSMVSAVEGRCGVRLSRLTNMYALFMIRAAGSVKKGGRMAFITPSEFLYTGYGRALKRFLLENLTIESIITLDPRGAVFEGALTTSAISLLVNEKAPRGHRVAFVRASGRLRGPDGAGRGALARRVRQDSLDPDSKWQKYYPGAAPPGLAEKLVPLSELARVKRGIATGANSFFTLSGDDARRRGIGDGFLAPVISRASQARGYEITRADMRRMDAAGQRAYLLYFEGEPSAAVRRYLRRGQRLGIHERYLCAHRRPWYRVERRDPAPVLATVFSRNNMRFVRNDAGCLNLAAYHGIYPRFRGRDMTDALLCYLNSGLCARVQEASRREYGGGLHKFEPGDLMALPVLPVTRLGRTAVEELARAFRRLAGSGNGRARREADEAVRRMAESL